MLEPPFIEVGSLGAQTLDDLLEYPSDEMEKVVCKVVGISRLRPYSPVEDEPSQRLSSIYPPLGLTDGFFGLFRKSIFPRSVRNFSASTLRTIVEQAPEEPFAMQVSSIAELEEHMHKIYQISFAHYYFASDPENGILEKRNFLGNHSFPEFHCGNSVKNVVVALMYHGYTNAVALGGEIEDHYYVVVPFTLGFRRGVILADPTSDQEGVGLQKNALFIKDAPVWEYKTQWKGGLDLYPHVARLVDIHLIRRRLSSWKGSVDLRKPTEEYTREYMEIHFERELPYSKMRLS